MTKPVPSHPPLAAQDFGDTVDVYDKVRPDYLPHQIKQVLRRLRISPDAVVADIGTGTGKLLRQFHGHCATLIGVEKSADMLGKCQKNLEARGIEARYVKGEAHETGIAPKSVDLIVAGDAAHWFEPPQEVLTHFKEILKNKGKVAIFVRYPMPQSPIVQRLHRMLEDKEHCSCREYQQPDANKLIDDGPLLASKKGERIVAPEGSQRIEEPMIMRWTKEDLLHYLQSRSSTKDWALAHPDKAMEEIVEPIFAAFSINGSIVFPYKAHVLMGKLREPEKEVEVQPSNAPAHLRPKRAHRHDAPQR